MKKLAAIFLLLSIVTGQARAALSAATVWEVRTTGAQTNGGGFVTGASGTDFSQQAAAQYALTTVTSAGATTVMTHASAAADMVGNICRVVSGTNATVGWYQIASVSVGVSLTVDRNWCTGAVANGVVNVGGAFLIGGTLDDEFTEAIIAGNAVHVQSGSYTLAEDIAQASSGTAVAPIKWIGYTTARNDACVGDNRPLFICAGYAMSLGSRSIVKNIRVTTNYYFGFYVAGYSYLYNCKATATGANAFYSGDVHTIWISCEGIATNGKAFLMGSNCVAISCYAHNSQIGYSIEGFAGRIINSIADTATTGISTSTEYGALIANNTIYNCTTGILGVSSQHAVFFNNIITGCTTGASWTTVTPINFWDFNCWNNTTDVSNVTKGPNAVTADPLLTDPANADFTLQAGSPCLDAGLQIGANEGVTGDYKINIGVDQDDNAAAPGGGGAAVYMGNF